MGSTVSRIAIAAGVAFGFLLWAGMSPGKDPGRDTRRLPVQGQEVVAGSCNGVVFNADEYPPYIYAAVYLSATSGIASDFDAPYQQSLAVLGDLDALAAACEKHVVQVSSQAPSICAVGAVSNESSPSSNASTVTSRFAFSCQGTRDEVIGVIGVFSRLSLVTQLP